MFPMIATVEEFDEAHALVERELTYLRRHGHKLPERAEIGSMVEVPSLLYQLDELLERADFLSVGSNDLMQFFYAADRGNARVADRFDPLSAPMLRALQGDRRQGRGARQAGHAVRRAGLQADRGARADRARLPLVLGRALRDRAGQGHAARSRRRQGHRAARADARQAQPAACPSASASRRSRPRRGCSSDWARNASAAMRYRPCCLRGAGYAFLSISIA